VWRPRVLSREADAVALGHERREGEVLGGAPVERRPGADLLRAAFDEGVHFGVRREARGQGRQLVRELDEALLRDRRGDLRRVGVGPTFVPGPEPAARGRALVVVALRGILEGPVEHELAIVADGVRAGLVDVTGLEEPPHVHVADRRLFVDRGVHRGLREARLVGLVVAVAAVAVHVDDDVLRELLPVLDGETRHVDDGLGILAVHVEHRDAHHARDVGAVAGRARVLGDRGEPDLVVDDEVHRAAGRVALEARHVERLGDHALTDEGRVAVDEEGHDAPPLATILFRADSTFDHRVHELEVARVEGEREVDALPGAGDAVRGVAEVVLHVAAADEALGVLVAEGGEELLRGLVHDVDEHVQAAAMGHAEHDLVDVVFARLFDEEVEHRDHALGAFEREPLCAEEVLVDELLEVLGVGELREDAEHLVVRERRAVSARLHLGLEPLAGFDVLDVTELDADGAPVGLAEVRDDRPERRVGRHSRDADRGERLVELRGREIEPVEVELVARLGRRAERVEVRVHVPARAVRVHELEDAALERRCVEEILARHGGRRRRDARGRGRPVACAVRGAVGAIDLGEEGSPLLVDRLRALKIAGVKLFYDAGVDTELLEHLVDPWVMALPRQNVAAGNSAGGPR
jgi:hypothetical protein